MLFMPGSVNKSYKLELGVFLAINNLARLLQYAIKAAVRKTDDARL